MKKIRFRVNSKPGWHARGVYANVIGDLVVGAPKEAMSIVAYWSAYWFVPLGTNYQDGEYIPVARLEPLDEDGAAFLAEIALRT